MEKVNAELSAPDSIPPVAEVKFRVSARNGSLTIAELPFAWYTVSIFLYSAYFPVSVLDGGVGLCDDFLQLTKHAEIKPANKKSFSFFKICLKFN